MFYYFTIFKLLIVGEFFGFNTWVFRVVCTRNGALLYDIRNVIIRIVQRQILYCICANNLPGSIPYIRSQLSEYPDHLR